jgi:hypothetical protein
MKLRFRGNSLRLRLTRVEIAELIETGMAENRVQLGAQPECALVYRLELSDRVMTPTIHFETSKICVHLPVTEGKAWAQGDKIGIYGEEPWGLKLMIEKDFKCLDPRLGEDESDAFENPGGATHAGCGMSSD